MKNKKTSFYEKWSTVFFWTILAIILSLILVSLQNKQPTYTQSDVSALMKFNASEFGCSVSEFIRTDGKLQILCKTYERWNFYQVIDNNLEKYDPCFGGQDVLNESHRIRCNANDTHQYFETLRTPQYKTLTYFPQFDGVKIELEPERQECVSKPKLEYDCRLYVQGQLADKYIFGGWFGYNDTNKQLKQAEDYGYVCGNLSYSKQFCQIIPAVTKTLSGWAISENDLATEFCRAKTYQIEDYRCDKWSEVSCNEKGTACGAGCVENRIINQTKSFTRGEVVEVLDDPTNIKNVLIPLQEKQKVIRCSSDDGTQKDFEAFK